MTKEIAEKIAKGIADKIECNTADIDDWAEFWGFTREDYEEFLDMAVKQPDLINKMKAEILENAFSVVNPKNTYEYINVLDLGSIEKIIDKYV